MARPEQSGRPGPGAPSAPISNLFARHPRDLFRRRTARSTCSRQARSNLMKCPKDKSIRRRSSFLIFFLTHVYFRHNLEAQRIGHRTTQSRRQELKT